MPITGLEAFCDAITHQEGWYPGTPSYQNRNPGNLIASPFAKQKDEHGFCIFPDFITGYNALKWDIAGKATGKNDLGLGPATTIYELFAKYAPAKAGNAPLVYAVNVASWCAHATGRALTRDSTLSAAMPELFTEVKP